MKTARFVRHLTGWKSDARLYRLSEPTADAYGNRTECVVVSAIVATFGPETYIFPSDGEGVTTNMVEMDGSFRGRLDHAEALRGAGYEITQVEA